MIIWIKKFIKFITIKTSRDYKVLVAAEESNLSHKAIQYGFDLCSRLNTSYKLSFIYIIALNPEANVPFL